MSPHLAALPATLAVCALGLALASCGARRAVPCASDIDCGAATSCDEGSCISPRTTRPPDLRPRAVSLTPLDDGTVVSAASQTEAFGGHDVLAVGAGPGGQAYRSYLRFDLREVGRGRVARAKLRLAARPRWCAGETPLEVVAYQAASGWTQAGLTWLGQPGGSGPPVGRAFVRPAYEGETVIDLTEVVRRWISRASPNHGVVLRAARETADMRVAWSSSEATVVRQRPTLDIEIE
jgi:hypothetical protein